VGSGCLRQDSGKIIEPGGCFIKRKTQALVYSHVDTGDFVIVINADKIEIQGKRAEQKEYFSHTGYPGGQKVHSFKEMLSKKPEFLIEHAVKGMLPKNRLGRQIIKKLKVYRNDEHPHKAQMPKDYELVN
jgi:large subunit ribosomal protein L13